MYGVEQDLDNLEILLQNDITNISRWFHENKLSVNTGKTCAIKVGSRHKVNASRDFRLNINDTILDQVKTSPHLDCTFHQYLQGTSISTHWSLNFPKVGYP